MWLPIDRFLNAVYVWCLLRVKDEDRDRFLYWLELPPPDAKPDNEAEMAAFDSFAAAFGVTPPAQR